MRLMTTTVVCMAYLAGAVHRERGWFEARTVDALG
jgi:hypothetical protein